MKASSIYQIVFKKATKIQVKLGSHRVSVTVNNKTNSSDVIRMALKEARINGTSSMYSLFERAEGVERQISPEQNIQKLISSWNKAQYELIIRFTRQQALASSAKRAIAFKLHRQISGSSGGQQSLGSSDHEQHFYETIGNDQTYHQQSNQEHLYETIICVDTTGTTPTNNLFKIRLFN